MADVFHVKEWKVEALKKEISSSIKHSNQEVERLWKEMALEAIERFCDMPSPGSMNISFNLRISEHDVKTIEKQLKGYIYSYSKSVEEKHLEMLQEIFRLQRRVAELKVNA